MQTSAAMSLGMRCSLRRYGIVWLCLLPLCIVYVQAVHDIVVKSTRAILCPRNKDVDEINAIMVTRLGGDRRTFLSNDQLEDSTKDNMNVPIEFLNSLTVSSLTHAHKEPRYQTRPVQWYHAGCRQPNDYVIDAKIITGSYKGERTYSPRIKLLSAPTDFHFSFSQRQFPIQEPRSDIRPH
ncbi:hypothetical protein PR048_002598 [Dryococelus australis]|uniref:Uncharacterized protein n=1 Tax=Dryococelus australis TaxID=614101 RepID=A0ABQ9IKR4_9NEOP|nr:hypothetical protein PR048_002598 [Dryococelus australis]